MEGDGKPFTYSSFCAANGFDLNNFIPIHQAHSHCRKPLLPLRHDMPDKTTGRHLIIWSKVCLYGTEREPAAMKYRAAPGTATTGNGDNETPA